MIPDSTPTCPRCQLPLKETKTQHGIFWGCGNCGGRAVTVELLRRTFTPESINPLWLHAIRGEGISSSGCPLCKRSMIEVWLADQGGVRVDVCRLCHFVWFDAHEVEHLTPRPPPPPGPPELPQAARELLAIQKVKDLARDAERVEFTPQLASSLWWVLSDFFRMR